MTVLLSAILVIVFSFFALTRTQVGRNGLRLQLMRTFAAQFEGRLEIDRLSGNLVNDLFAGGVRLYDGDGALVLSADSVVARPSWRDLLRRRVTLGSLTLHRPEIHLERADDGSWNVVQALSKRRKGSGGGGDPWSFTSLNLRILDGAVSSRNVGRPPEAVSRGQIFDFTNALASDLNVRATVDWRTDARVVELQSASARIETLDLDLARLQGQVVIEDDDLLLPLLDFRLGASHGR
ncbi:MAG TPA: hypothetical protein VF190_07685, partial [Rhodothermales bacterium]